MQIINEMKLEFMGVPENEGFARVAVSAFAVQLDPTLDVLADIKTAVSEAVTNAIVHGYADAPGGVVTVAAVLRDDGVLALEIMDKVTVESKPGEGTTVRMQKRLREG